MNVDFVKNLFIRSWSRAKSRFDHRSCSFIPLGSNADVHVSEQFDRSVTIKLSNHDEIIQFGSAKIDHILEIINADDQLITHLTVNTLIQKISHSKNVRLGSQQARFEQSKHDDGINRVVLQLHPKV